MREILREFLSRLEDEEVGQFRSVIVHQDGKLRGEVYNAPPVPYNIHSVSKSFTATAVGFAIDEGILSLSDKVVDAFPDLLPETVSDWLGSLTLRHLLMMSSGHAQSHGQEKAVHFGFYEKNTDWLRQYLHAPIIYEPGTRFWYDSGDTYTAGVMLQKKVGMTTVEYLKSRLFDPLQIETPYWVLSPEGYNIGFTGLWLKTEDMLKLAELYRNVGSWHGRRLLSLEWAKEATSNLIATDTNHFNYGHEALGYGFQIWQCKEGGFRGSGMGGQHTIAIPKYNASIAISVYDVPKMHRVLEIFWDVVVPTLA